MLSVLYQWQEWSSTLVLAIGFDIEPPQAELLNALLEAIPDWPPRPFDGEDGAPWDASRHCAAVASLFKRNLSETWVMMISGEAVAQWLTTELGGNDVLHSWTRGRLAELSKRLLTLKEDYQDAVGDVELPAEPDPELVDLLKAGIRKRDH